MNMLIISDLHICNGDTFGTFGWNTEDFIQSIEMLKIEYRIDKIILNGDIYEMYKYRYDDIARNNRKLINYLQSDSFVYIKGNHDLLSENGLESYLITNSSGKKIYIEHGHNADFLNGTELGRITSRYFYKLLKKMIRFEPVYKIYYAILKFDEAVDKIPTKYNSYKYLNYALRLFRDYDVVILGHTHKIETHHTYYQSSKKKYLNCGSCSLGRLQGIVLDTETLKYETIKISSDSMKKNLENKNIFRLAESA